MERIFHDDRWPHRLAVDRPTTATPTTVGGRRSSWPLASNTSGPAFSTSISYVGSQGHFLQPDGGNPRGYWADQLDQNI